MHKKIFTITLLLTLTHCFGSLRMTPLHIAARDGNLSQVKALLAQGANTNPTADKDTTPLHFACIHGHVDIAVALLDAGANIEAPDAFQETPLHSAVSHERIDLVELLLTRGANHNALNEYDMTPVSFCQKNRVLMALFLQKKR